MIRDQGGWESAHSGHVHISDHNDKTQYPSYGFECRIDERDIKLELIEDNATFSVNIIASTYHPDTGDLWREIVTISKQKFLDGSLEAREYLMTKLSRDAKIRLLEAMENGRTTVLEDEKANRNEMRGLANIAGSYGDTNPYWKSSTDTGAHRKNMAWLDKRINEIVLAGK